jgi:hypothetical protein
VCGDGVYQLSQETQDMKTEYDPDRLKPFDKITEADSRQGAFSRFDAVINNFTPITLEDHYESISTIALDDRVPEKISIQYETAKNIYLYAWYAYRLFPVAEHHALICLEYALRERFAAEVPKKYWNNKNYGPTLAPLLSYIIDTGKIKNEHFEVWHQAAERRAQDRYQLEKIKEMSEQGLSEIEIDYDEIEVLDEDRNWGYLNILKKSLKSIRNTYAHGGPLLHRQVLGTFKIVKEILDQIFIQGNGAGPK